LSHARVFPNCNKKTETMTPSPNQQVKCTIDSEITPENFTLVCSRGEFPYVALAIFSAAFQIRAKATSLEETVKDTSRMPLILISKGKSLIGPSCVCHYNYWLEEYGIDPRKAIRAPETLGALPRILEGALPGSISDREALEQQCSHGVDKGALVDFMMAKCSSPGRSILESLQHVAKQMREMADLQKNDPQAFEDAVDATLRDFQF
jgi:hypothetical protein